MTIRMNQFSLTEQLKIGLLSKAEQDKILNSKDMEAALALLERLENTIKLDEGVYEPTLQISGTIIKYKTKNLFTENFDKKDVLDFMTLAEMTSMMEDEIIFGELMRKIQAMHKEGKQPLQCMVYATKKNGKIFYNNEKKMTVWAKVIAQTVNDNLDYTLSLNHMLVNWSMWKNQLTMIITACSYIKKDSKLDAVIRDLYSGSDDDKIRFTVLKRLLYSNCLENYKCVFLMLKNSDFIKTDSERKYFNALKKRMETATPEEKEKFFKAFKTIPGFPTIKHKRISALFEEHTTASIVEKINNSLPNQKEEILQWVKKKVYGSPKDYRDIAYNARNIRLYRPEIQEMFINKLEKRNLSHDEIKVYSIAIGELDTKGIAFPLLEERLTYYNDDEKQLMFAYALATLSDKYINKYIEYLLKYDGFNAETIIPLVKQINRTGARPLIRQHLYANCIRIKDESGSNSRIFRKALSNLGIYLKNTHTENIYDIKFDQLLFDFIGYNKIDSTFDKSKCTANTVKLVLSILDTVMTKNNYEGRYMNFMWAIFAYFKTSDIELANRIDRTVKKLTGQGIPSI